MAGSLMASSPGNKRGQRRGFIVLEVKTMSYASQRREDIQVPFFKPDDKLHKLHKFF